MRLNAWQFADDVTAKKNWQSGGQALYESDIRQEVEARNEGRIVAINIETGTFEVDDNVLPATNRLFEQNSDAQPWVIRIGHCAVDHFGARSLKRNNLIRLISARKVTQSEREAYEEG